MTVSNEFTYKAKVTKSGNWQRYNTARMGISVGQPYHEGEKFHASLEWVKHRFDHVQILIADTLQRHNFIGGDTTENRDLARCAGDDWLERNNRALGLLSNKTIIRWDSLLLDEDFEIYYRHPDVKDIQSPYVREEVAAVLMLQDRQPASEIYPGSFLPIWNEISRQDLSLTSISFMRVPIKNTHDMAA